MRSKNTDERGCTEKARNRAAFGRRRKTDRRVKATPHNSAARHAMPFRHTHRNRSAYAQVSAAPRESSDSSVGWSRSRSVRAGSESPQDFHSLPTPRLRRALSALPRRDCYTESRSFSGAKARLSNAEMQAKPPKMRFWDLETHSNRPAGGTNLRVILPAAVFRRRYHYIANPRFLQYGITRTRFFICGNVLY